MKNLLLVKTVILRSIWTEYEESVVASRSDIANDLSVCQQTCFLKVLTC